MQTAITFQLAGLIGDPVSHSRSPAIHNAAFAHLGLRAYYECWPTPASQLAARIESLRAPHILGANVTLPHKIAVLSLLDRLTSYASSIGAVNTIVRMEDGSLEGDNTDAPAFLSSLREDAGYTPSGERVIILGASGAARAAVVALVQAGAAEIVIINRTLERAEELLADILLDSAHEPTLYAIAPGDPMVETLIADASLIVNATSLGWHSNETPLAATLIPPKALVFDMVYRQTRLLCEAAARGAQTIDGLGMLVRQAALSFERWTGHRAPLEVMRAAVAAE